MAAPNPSIKDESHEVYANSVRMYSGIYDVLFRFVNEQMGVDGESVDSRVVSTVRLSIEQAWVFSRILARHMDERMQQTPIFLAAELLKELGLEDEYDRIHQGG